MARKTTFNEPSRQVVQTVEDQHKYDTPTFRRLNVYAQPGNYFVTPSTADANTLALALMEAAPTLAVLNHGINKEYHESKVAEGQAAALKDLGLPEEDKEKFSWFSSPSFKKGYESVNSLIAGMEDSQKLKADFEADPNRNNMTTQEWVGQWMQKNQPKGVSGDYMNGWNQQVLPELKAITLQGAQDKVSDGMALVNQKKTDAFKATIEAGWTPETAAKLKLSLQGDGTAENPGLVAMNNGDWDREFIKQVDTYINAGGDPEKARQALKWAKDKRPDGTPGIYYKPGMAKVIDDLEDKAYSVAIQKNNLQENMDRIGRGGDQQKDINDILTTALDKGVDSGFKALNQAVKTNPELWSPGLRMATMEKLRRIQTLKKGDGDGSATTAYDAGLVSRAIKGEIGSDEIADLVANQKIKPGLAGTLMSYTTRADKMDKTIFKTPAYSQGLMLLQSLPERPAQNIPDPDGSIARSMAARKALAIASYNQEVAKSPDADPNTLARNIHKSESQFMAEDRAIKDPYFDMYVPKYPSREAFMQALSNNSVKPGVDVKREGQHWNWLQSQGKGK